jgi:DHA1 family bicyclomycin/chloramphenicol resistance-like MFS transporter
MQLPSLSLTEKHTLYILRTLLCLMLITGMAVDLLAPSLPAIAANLHVSHSITKNLISIYILGFALGNFVAGFLTDAWGRKKMIRLSLSGFVFASLIPLIFPKIFFLLFSRFLQGFALGGVSLLVRAIFSDILPAKKIMRYATLMATMWSIGPIVGPVIGGYLQFYLGWESIFWFFVFIGLIGFIAVFMVVPETHLQQRSLNVVSMKKEIYAVVSHGFFMSLVLLMGLSFSLIIIFNTVAPFLIQEKLHYSSVFFGHVALWMGVVFLLGTFACRFLADRMEMNKLFRLLTYSLVIISGIFVAVSYLFKNSLLLIILASGIMFVFNAFILPLCLGRGLPFFRSTPGIATAIMYSTRMLMASLIGFLISLIVVENNISLMWLYFLLSLAMAFVYCAGESFEKK